MSALRVAAGHDRGFPFEIEDNRDGSRLAKFVSQREAFRFIRAVNSHDELVSALEALVAGSDSSVAEIRAMGLKPDSGALALVERGRAALARAKDDHMLDLDEDGYPTGLPHRNPMGCT